MAPHSWARFRCLFEQVDPDHQLDEDDDIYINLNPFKCTHAYIREGPIEGHGHEYQRSWEVAEMRGRELLGLCAEVYDLIGEVVDLAHTNAGAGIGAMMLVKDKGTIEEIVREDHRLPCVDDNGKYRTVRTNIRDGQEVWDDPPEHF